VAHLLCALVGRVLRRETHVGERHHEGLGAFARDAEAEGLRALHVVLEKFEWPAALVSQLGELMCSVILLRARSWALARSSRAMM
jgi:hypothetical protein